MAVVETKEYAAPSWVQRMGESFKGILTGFVLFVAGFPLLFWNEGRAVATAKSLDAGQKAVVSAAAEKVDPANEGKLVHVTGTATTKDVLSDTLFGVNATAIKLEREVEIFQWVEHEETKREKVGDKIRETTKYTYEKKWCDAPVSSAEFKEAGHDNPPVVAFEDTEKIADNVTLGAFRLGQMSIKRIGGAVPLTLPDDHALPPELAGAKIREGVVYVPGKAPVAAPAAPSNAVATASADASNAVATASVGYALPEVGDQRVKFKQVLPHEVSIVGRQLGNTFSTWTAPNGRDVYLQRDGVKDAESMFAAAKSANTFKTWLLRLIGFLAMFFGLKMVLGPVETLVSAIPILNAIVSTGVSFAAFAVSAACSFMTVGIAWLFYRPVLGIALLVAAVGIIVWAVMKKKAKPAQAGAVVAK